MALLQSLPSKMSVSSRASTRVLPWLITVCPLILLFHLSAALPVQDLRVDHALGQASQWNALTGIQRPDDFSTEGVSSQHFMRDGALPTSNVPFSHFRSQSSRQRRYSPLKKALDSTNHPASIPHEGDDLSRSNQQPQTLSDLVSFLDADRAKGLTLEDLSNLGITEDDIIRAAPQAQSSPEWRTTVLSYLLNMKAKGHKIQPVDLTKEELLANQSIRPEDEQNVVCKVSPYRVCFHMGEDGKLRPLRKAHQPMNIVRVY
ncbi:uncharacterized protein LOC131883300 isoform X2 [Tigriopus californicus]|uniref:uncharacterized protein LOC131883300 isoform X2 n=1 Tax=Tigriopus californicus TaxID=6832 RepID=UPI0027D9FE72|nr:uncharacterized protein LOC131883300 isoform X2 [Tigriopus californicus]